MKPLKELLKEANEIKFENTGLPIGARREKEISDVKDNVVDTYKAIVNNDSNAIKNLQKRQIETFGGYTAPELLLDVATFIGGAGAGKAVTSLTLKAIENIARKKIENTIVKKALQYTAETSAGTITQNTVDGTTPFNRDGSIDKSALATQILLNAPFDAALHVPSAAKAALKHIDEPPSEKQNFIDFNDMEYKNEQPNDVMFANSDNINADIGDNTAAFYDDKNNKIVILKDRNKDKDYLNEAMHHEKTHKNFNEQVGGSNEKIDEFFAHMASIASLKDKQKRIEAFNSYAQRYNKKLLDNSYIESLMNKVDNGEKLSGKERDDLQEYVHLVTLIDEPNAINDLLKTSWVKEKINEAKGKKNFIAKHDIFNEKPDITNGATAYKAPKDIKDSAENIYESLFMPNIEKDEFIKNEIKHLYGIKDDNFNVKIVDDIPSKVKYDGKDILIDKRMLASEDSIYEMLRKVDNELTKAYSEQNSIMPHVNDFIANGNEENLIKAIESKHGGSQIVDDVKAILDKFKNDEIDQSEFLSMMQKIDSTKKFNDIGEEPPQQINAMNKQQRIKNRLFEKINKNTKDDYTNVSKEKHQDNLKTIQDYKLEKDYVNKAYEQIKTVIENDKDLDRLLEDYVKTKVFDRNKIKKDIAKRVKNGEDKNKVVQEWKTKIDNTIEKVKSKKKDVIERANFKDELERNIDIYTEPSIEKNRIVLDRINKDAVIDYLFKKALVSERDGEALNKKLERAESKKAKDVYEKQKKINIEKANKLKNNSKKEKQEENKEPPKQETKQKTKKRNNEKVDIRFRKSVKNNFKDFGAIKNNIKIEEYLKLKDIDHPDHMGTTYNKEVYAAGGSNAMQAYTIIHELTHNVFPEMSEDEVTKLSKEVLYYMVGRDLDLAKRLGFKDTIEPPKINEKIEKVIKYINGNEKAEEALFGKQSLFDKYIAFEDKVSEVIDRRLRVLRDVLGVKSNDKDIEMLGRKLPKAIKKILIEMDFFNPKKEHIEQALHYKKEAKDILNRIVANIKKQVEESGIDKDKMMFIIESDYERMLPHKYFVEIFDEKKMKTLYKSFVKKYGKEKIKNFLKHNDESFKQTKYYLSTVKEYEDFFGGSKHIIPALQLRAWYMMKKRGIKLSESDLEKMKVIFSEVKDMTKKAGLDESSFMVGYYPHIYDTPYDIKVAFTKDDELKLKTDGYKHYKENVWYKLSPEQDVSSSVFFFEKKKRAGFTKIVNTKKEKAEILKRFGDNVKFVKTNKGLLAVVQPKVVRELVKFSDDPSELIAGTYKKSFEEFFNNTVIKEVSKDILDNIISVNKKDGFKATSKEETAFLNKILERNEEEYYIDENYYHYIFNKEILPDNEHLANAFKMWKSVVQRLKGNLTFKSVSAFVNNNIAGFVNLAYIGVNPKYIPNLFRTTVAEYREFTKFIDKYHRIVASKGFEEGQKFLKANKKNNIFIEVMLESKLGSLIESPDILFGRDNTYLDKILMQQLRNIDNKYGTTLGGSVFSLYKTLSLDRSTVVGKYLFNFYGMSDLFYRVMAYKYLKNRFNKEEAIKQINDIFVDYSRPVQPELQTLEFSGFPFLIWYTRMQGGLLRIAKKRPVTFASLIAGYIALQYALDDEWEPKNDEFVKGLRVESWFAHKVLFDPMTFQASIANQFLNGKIDKVLELSAMPKTYEEAIAVSQGKRNPMEMLGLNFEPQFMVGKHKHEFYKRKE